MDKQVKDMAGKVAARAAGQSDLVAVIPAGGLGGQMYPVTSAMPKALLPLNNRPLLVTILQQLNSSVFKKCFVTCNEWYTIIRNYLDAFRSQISIEFECVKTNKQPPKFLKELSDRDELSDPFLLHYCDVWIKDIDWKWVLETYTHQKKKKGIIAMLLVSRCFSYPVGIVSLNPRGNLITEFRQKPQNIVEAYANCAVAFLSKEFVENHIAGDEVDIFDTALAQAVKTQKVAGFEVADWHHFQQIRDWLNAQKEYYDHIPF